MDMNGPKRLFDMEIDEISLVDRGANQHAAIVFSKALRAEEDVMDEDELYDEFGGIVEEVALGDIVYDAEGNEYVVEEDDGSDDEGEYMYEPEYAEVGKAGLAPNGRFLLQGGSAPGRFGRGFKEGRKLKAWHKGGMQGDLPESVLEASTNPLQGRIGRAGMHVGAHAGKYAAGGAGVAGAGAGGAYYANRRRVEKSLGDVVLEELSKAASEDERSEVIAKAMAQVEEANQYAEQAWQMVAKQEDDMLAQAFISKAAEFNLPVDPVEFGLILKAASTVLDADQLDLLENLFNGIGEILYEEIGYEGDNDNVSVMDMVDSYASEAIGKSRDVSPEMVSTAIFDMNPSAYDAYMAEKAGF